MMRSTWCILNLLLAWITLTTSSQAISPLNQWLQDADARKALTDALGGEEPLLARAYDAALNNFNSQDIRVSQTCLADIATYLQFNTSWAAKFADSSVKLPEGILVGAMTHLGNWDECVSVRDKKSVDQTKKLHGQMCLTTVTAGLEYKENIIGRGIVFELPMQHAMRAEDPSFIPVIMLRLGVCVPSTCKAVDIQELFKLLIHSLPSVGKVKLVAQVNDGDCTTQDRPPLDTVDWVAIGILIVLGILLVASTTYDVVLPTERKRTLFTAFSIVSNGKKMLGAPRPGGDTTLSCLHGMRFISMCWVVLGHRYSMQIEFPIINPLYYYDFRDNIWRVGIMNATLSVDTFFVLSGLLLAYLFFKVPHASRRLNIPLYYLHRYIRLTPALAMMVLLSASLISHIGWGPLWPLYWDFVRENCQKSWWSTLLYVNNYGKPEVTCVGQSWYLMVDMQLYWLSPLIIFPLIKAPRLGQIFIGILCISGLVINFVLSFVLDIPGNLMAQTDQETALTFFKDFYIPTYTRFVPYLEGLALGYFLATQKVNDGVRNKFSWIVSFALWLIVAALLLVPLFLGYYFYQVSLPSKIETAFYNCFSRSIWSLGVVGVIYLCVAGHGKPVNTFLSWTGFQILGRFTYGIYLVHGVVLGLQAASARTYSYLSDSVILPAFAGDLLLSLLFAAVLSLVCESPFLIIEKELLGTRQRREKIQKPDIQNSVLSKVGDEKKSDDKNV